MSTRQLVELPCTMILRDGCHLSPALHTKKWSYKKNGTHKINKNVHAPWHKLLPKRLRIVTEVSFLNACACDNELVNVSKLHTQRAVRSNFVMFLCCKVLIFFFFLAFSLTRPTLITGHFNRASTVIIIPSEN